MTIDTDTSEERERDAVLRLLGLPAIARMDPALAGGRALVAHGVATETTDFDFLIDCHPSALPDLAAALGEAGYRIDVLSELAIRGGNSVELRCYWRRVQIDLIPTAVPRLKEVHQRARRIEWMGVEVRLLGLADILVEKLRTGRIATPDLYRAATALMSPAEKRLASRDSQALDPGDRRGALIRDLFGG